jgi:hypothetical protein
LLSKLNTASSDFASRATRARVLLGTATAVHAVILTTTLGVIVAGLVPGVGITVAAGVLVVLAVFAIASGERNRGRALRPVSWPPRALVSALPEGVAASLSTGTALGLSTWGATTLGMAVVAVHVALAVAARNALLRPLLPGIGLLDHEVVAKVRLPEHAAQPRWTSPDHVRLTTTEIAIVVRSGVVAAAQATIALVDVDAVTVRQATVADGPWLQLPDGTFLPLAGGEIVAVRHRGQQQILLPVYDAAAFAEVLRVRADRAREARRNG